MSLQPVQNGEDEVVILIKAAPNATRSGETVCCAGIDIHGNWRRLYPVNFRRLNDDQKFKRWDLIGYKWRMPKDDQRPESRRIDSESLIIRKRLPERERANFIGGAVVTGVNNELKAGRTLALLKPRDPRFVIERRSDDEVTNEAGRFKLLSDQSDMFSSDKTVPYEPCPFAFKFHYESDDGKRVGTCQDWETDAVFWRWRREYGEEKALEEMARVFGDEYPAKGMLLAMGTHSRYPDKWLINGVIRCSIEQMQLF